MEVKVLAGQADLRQAGLRYVTDQSPGIRRIRRGKSFSYRDAEGKPVRDEEILRRIRSLAIPPAWSDVWICPTENGHVQATGRDARGRKQYRYHERWRETRDANKYGRMAEFAQVLPRLRKRVSRDLAKSGLPREKVLATVVKLLELTLVRVGNEEYVRQNGSYGLTTMQDRHVRVRGPQIQFVFKGKTGRQQTVGIRDRRLARVVRQCEELPGQELFQYVDEQGTRHPIDSQDVNDYIREASGGDFTAKDFRTWAGTVLTARLLREMEPAESAAQAKRNVVAAIEQTARVLGNTPAVCRRCYVHPGVLDAYQNGTMLQMVATVGNGSGLLTAEEAAALAQLRRIQPNGRSGRRPPDSPRGRSKR